jgi:hypothetical protein
MAGLKGFAGGFPGNASDLYTTPYPASLGDKARDRNGNEFLFVDFGAAGLSIGSVVGITAAHVAFPLSTTSPTAAGGSRVGVVVAASPTSLQAGWVQVYGFALVQADAGLGTGAASASDVTDTSTRTLTPTTVVTSPQGALSLVNLPVPTSNQVTSLEIDEIIGMWMVPGPEATDIVGYSGDMSGLDHMVTGSAVTQVSETSGIGVTNTTAGISTNYITVFLNYPYHSNAARQLSLASS